VEKDSMRNVIPVPDTTANFLAYPPDSLFLAAIILCCDHLERDTICHADLADKAIPSQMRGSMVRKKEL
jgi:hypothetical protein